MEQTWLPGKVRDRIRDLMKERGLTQAELALRIGTTESTLSRFLSGKTDSSATRVSSASPAPSTSPPTSYWARATCLTA